ncbi:tyrosine-type recombinase/integrase [Photobacterium leiognathi]|uniref:tyrosine-type recombinase/integrase n=1 Tax=Photobacterium leiognathi TaxID=553611 RepID=UPI002981A959|nr:tyrosine-type recombinase/integrase [Photobacterium leiognathi]
MTHSSNSVFQFESNTDDLFTPKQLDWLSTKVIPKRLFIKAATEFDDQWLNTSQERWEYRFSGRNFAIDFHNGKNFKELSESTIKLVKLITIKYACEYSASKIYDVANDLGLAFKEMKSLTHDTFVAHLNKLCIVASKSGDFFNCLYACRKLDIHEFFEDTDGDADIEDKLLFVPRPAVDNWGIYSDIDNVLPQEVVSMIENGLEEWSAKLTPSLATPEEKHRHMEQMRQRVSVDKLRDCIILGLNHCTGARPVQISKFAVGDVYPDTELSSITRFAAMIPYAKKSKVNVDRVRVALPEELGKLIFLYQNLANLQKGDPLFPQHEDATKMVSGAIKRQLLRFSSKEMQAAVEAGEAEAPVYTASVFRHHVGHSMAMSGASAEEIAYILGHTSTVVANRYVSATPSLAEIREKALGTNPVFKNMIAMMLTGNLIYRQNWTGRKVAGCVGGKLHHNVGGCNYEEPMCPFAQVRACYGCLYFKPFVEGDHQRVFDAFNDEIISHLKLSKDTNEEQHPLIPELTRRKEHVMSVVTRIALFNQTRGASNA